VNIIKRILPGIGKPHFPLHLEESPSPFFIVGSGRCGTTLLRRELSNVASVHIPPETFALPDAIATFKNSSTTEWDVLVEQVLAKFDYHHEFNYFEIPSLRPLSYQLKQLPKEQRCLEKIISGIYHYHATFHNQKFEIWGDKTPMHVWHMSAIREVYPNVKFIHLIRDGVDVVNSWLKARKEYSIEQAAKRWTSAIQSFELFEKRYPDNCYVIRYEGLVENPSEVIKQLCEFLDINYDLSRIDQRENVNKMGDVTVLKHHKNVFNSINMSSVGKGRELFELDERKLLHTIIGSELKKHGYQSIL